VSGGASAGTISLTLAGVTPPVVAPLAATPSGWITEYTPSSGTLNEPNGITAGPDGNVWFTDSGDDMIGKITPAGTITEFGTASAPDAITVGPGGNLWFLDSKVGTITTAGAITEFSSGTIALNGIAFGPDGNLWFTSSLGTVGVMTSGGSVIASYGTTLSDPIGIAAGPDGNQWVAEFSVPGKIARVLTAGGAITEFSSVLFSEPFGITPGPDGKLWFTADSGAIGNIDTSGTFTVFALAAGTAAFPQGITAGPDGNLWFTQQNSGAATGQIGRITTSGTITYYGGTLLAPQGITAGPDGNIWFTEGQFNHAGKIGRIVP
jgi:streptogramin lyase